MIIPRISDIVGIINKIAPPGLAEGWDNVGLQLGDPEARAGRIMVALDPGRAAVEAAVEADCRLLVTHHPFFFAPLKKISAADETGRLAILALKSELGILSLHTNFDIAAGGVNDLLAQALGLSELEPLRVTGSRELVKLAVFVPQGDEEKLRLALSPFAVQLGPYRDCSFSAPGTGRFTPLAGAAPYLGRVGEPETQPENRLELLVDRERLSPLLAALKKAHPYEEPAFDLYPVLNRGESWGLGRIARLPEPVAALDYARLVKERLHCQGVRFVGDPERPVRKVALCGGSGMSLLHEAARKGADLLVTADVKYHEAREAEALGVALVDAGHFATERVMVDGVARALGQALEARRFETEIVAYKGEREPFIFL